MSITSANAIITLVQPILFPTPQQLQNFSVDEITDIDEVEVLEEQMGVDGILSFGFVWVPRRQRIMLKADSPSIDFFDTIMLQQQAVQDVYALGGEITFPSVGKKYDLVNGGLKNYKPIPRAARTLQPQSFQIIWNQVLPSPA